jgi:hypothetical protein
MIGLFWMLLGGLFVAAGAFSYFALERRPFSAAGAFAIAAASVFLLCVVLA